MAGVNTILPFDVTGENMLTDTAYNTDSQRINGLTSGIARSNLMNKVLHQTTTVCAAIGDFLASKGYTVNDTDYELLSTKMTEFFDDYVKADTLSINEGVYRNLMLSANISADSNYVALGKLTPYNLTHGLGYAFVYYGNITSKDDADVLKICDSRYEIASSSTALAAMNKNTAVCELWRANDFLTLGKIKKTTTLLCNDITNGDQYEQSYTFDVFIARKDPTAVNSMYLSPNWRDRYGYFSSDYGKTWEKLSERGEIYFSSDYKYFYVIQQRATDNGTPFYSGDSKLPTTFTGSGTLKIRNGSVYTSGDALTFKSGIYYWVFLNVYTGTTYQFAEAWTTTDPINLTFGSTYNWSSTNVAAYSYWDTVVQMGSYIFAIMHGQSSSGVSPGSAEVRLLLFKDNTTVIDKSIEIQGLSYSSNIDFKSYVQFEPDTTETCKVRIYMHDTETGGVTVNKYFTVDATKGTITEITASNMFYNQDFDTGMTFLVPENTKYKYIMDNFGYIVGDNMVDGRSLIFPMDSKFNKRQIRPVEVKMVKEIESSKTPNNYAGLNQYFDYNEHTFTNYYAIDKKFYVDTIYFDDVD